MEQKRWYFVLMCVTYRFGLKWRRVNDDSFILFYLFLIFFFYLFVFLAAPLTVSEHHRDTCETVKDLLFQVFKSIVDKHKWTSGTKIVCAKKWTRNEFPKNMNIFELYAKMVQKGFNKGCLYEILVLKI